MIQSFLAIFDGKGTEKREKYKRKTCFSLYSRTQSNFRALLIYWLCQESPTSLEATVPAYEPPSRLVSYELVPQQIYEE